MSAPVLEVSGVGKTFGGLAAVSDFRLRLEEGDLQALIGPNGAGKTTCFNLLTGVYQPDTGTIRLGGLEIAGKKPYQIAAAGMSRTFQNIRLFANLSVVDNVRVACHLRAKHTTAAALLRTPSHYAAERDMTAQAMRLLEIFGLASRASEPAASLPYGDQRRLEIARAIATRPKVLLLAPRRPRRLAERTAPRRRRPRRQHRADRAADNVRTGVDAVPRQPVRRHGDQRDRRHRGSGPVTRRAPRRRWAIALPIARKVGTGAGSYPDRAGVWPDERPEAVA
jgi:branched-chain amino acid transport system ATP-binding protein